MKRVALTKADLKRISQALTNITADLRRSIKTYVFQIRELIILGLCNSIVSPFYRDARIR
jgi:hypothetical protein